MHAWLRLRQKELAACTDLRAGESGSRIGRRVWQFLRAALDPMLMSFAMRFDMSVHRRWSLAAATLASLAASVSAAAQTRWTLTETLRIGGAEAGPASFNYVKGLDADSRGNVFVYDRQTQDIRMFAPDGKLVKVIGRKGSGPGEFRDAEGIGFDRTDSLWVRDAANARLSQFTHDGVFVKGWTMTFCTSQGMWTPQFDNQRRILETDCLVTAGRASSYVIKGYHQDRSRVDTIGEMPECGTKAQHEAATWIIKRGTSTTYMSIPFASRPLSAIGPAADSWCVSNSAEYAIRRSLPGSNDTIRLTRALTGAAVTKGERDSVIAAHANALSGADLSRVPTRKPVIERITVDEQDRLWVRRTNAKGGVEFDIVAPTGKLVATAELGVVRASSYTPFVVRGSNLYLVALDEDDVPRVVRYRIGR